MKVNTRTWKSIVLSACCLIALDTFALAGGSLGDSAAKAQVAAKPNAPGVDAKIAMLLDDEKAPATDSAAVASAAVDMLDPKVALMLNDAETTAATPAQPVVAKAPQAAAPVGVAPAQAPAQPGQVAQAQPAFSPDPALAERLEIMAGLAAGDDPKAEGAPSEPKDMLETGLAELAKQTKPWIEPFGGFFVDKNDVSVVMGGVTGRYNLGSAGDLALTVSQGYIHQAAKKTRPESSMYRGAYIAGLEKLFITPELEAWGKARIENFSQFSWDRGTNDFDLAQFDRNNLYANLLFGWDAGLKYHFEDTSYVALSSKRESYFAEQDSRDTRVYNRVIDLSLFNPDMALNKFKAEADIVTLPEHRLHAEGSFEAYDDGNARFWTFAHYQIPIEDDKQGMWTAIKPNFYYESLLYKDGGYFSPERHFTAGLLLHTVRQYKWVDFSAEINPRLLWTVDNPQQGETNFGIVAYSELAAKPSENLRIGVSGFGQYDIEQYWATRLSAFIRWIF